MALTGGFLVLMLCASISGAVSVFQPISGSHLSALPTCEWIFQKDTYKALRTFEVLGLEKKPDVSSASCGNVSEPLSFSSLILKDMLETTGLLNFSIDKENFEDTISRLKVALSTESSLFEKANEALRAFEVFGVEEKPNVSVAGCKLVLEALGSSTSLDNIFYGLKVNGILNCTVDAEIFEDSGLPSIMLIR